MRDSDNLMMSKQAVCSVSKKIGFGLALSFLLSGCWAPAIKPSNAEIDKLRAILIVPVESPPLEIIPDPLEQRIPAYRHYQNMALAFPVQKRRYRTPGGIVIAGLVGNDDDQAVISEGDRAPMMAPATQSEPDWTPAKAAARQAMEQLSAHHVQAVLSREDYRLPMTDAERDAHLHHWHSAVMQWYGLEQTPADYSRLGRFDAVLELGIGSYRIFEGQTSLQVLLKLIDPVTRRVIARSRADNFRVDGAAPASLGHDSEAFKQLIGSVAGPLLTQSLNEIGWRAE